MLPSLTRIVADACVDDECRVTWAEALAWGAIAFVGFCLVIALGMWLQRRRRAARFAAIRQAGAREAAED